MIGHVPRVPPQCLARLRVPTLAHRPPLLAKCSENRCIVFLSDEGEVVMGPPHCARSHPDDFLKIVGWTSPGMKTYFLAGGRSQLASRPLLEEHFAVLVDVDAFHEHFANPGLSATDSKGGGSAP